MKILFIHQSFPGQYRHILNALAKEENHEIVGLGVADLKEEIPRNIKYYQYKILRGNSPGIHQWLLDIDSKLIRAESCARAARELKERGFNPDLICAHPGWGEALLIKQIWHDCPLLCYQEFYYNVSGYDYGFDENKEKESNWIDAGKVIFKKANPLMMLEQSDWNVTPTKFQRGSFPEEYRRKISVIHDGIDTNKAAPLVKAKKIKINDNLELKSSDTIVTFVNRYIEP